MKRVFPTMNEERERERAKTTEYLCFDLLLLLVDAETLHFRSFMLLFLALDLEAPVNENNSMQLYKENK
jgi:hypothetical protein